VAAWFGDFCTHRSSRRPDRRARAGLVVPGHAHSGTFEATIGTVPVYNVSVPVIARDFWFFELDVPTPAHATIHQAIH
jgi:hypothetical protein